MPAEQTTAPLDRAAYLEGMATAMKCPRHVAAMRACTWDNNKPCYCREMMELIYGK